jgi:GT2 family glycosyltransferase
MATPVCSIIVPVFQDSAILNIFLNSLWQTIEVPSQVVLLNDGSGRDIDELIDSYRRRVPSEIDAERHSWPHTRGCAHTLNAGLKLAVGEIVIFADSDLILTNGWQTALLDAVRCPNVGSAGALLIYPQTGGVQHCGIAFSEDIGRHLFLNASPDDVPQGTFTVQSVVFALCAIPRFVTDAVGFLDESYFNGYEDLDYNMRIVQLGLQVVMQPRARAYHWERANGPNRTANRKRNLGRFWRQWGHSIQSDLDLYLIRQLIEVGGQDTVFRGIDLCRDRPCAAHIWEVLQPEVSISGVDDLSYMTGMGSEVWLPQVLGLDGHRTAQRFLFLVDNFVQLLGNRYWIELRRLVRDDDIVIDLYANALLLQRLYLGCWPGTKIR